MREYFNWQSSASPRNYEKKAADFGVFNHSNKNR